MSSTEYFDTVACDWDAMRTAFFSEAVRDRAFAAEGVERGKIAADIGAGTGFITEGLIGRGLKVFTVDQSAAILTEMRRKFAAHDGIDYRVTGAQSLPIPDASVDYAFANMFLHHVEHPGKASREMACIQKPGGKLIITDLDEHCFVFLTTEHHDRWMGFNRDDIRQWCLAAD